MGKTIWEMPKIKIFLKENGQKIYPFFLSEFTNTFSSLNLVNKYNIIVCSHKN